jgi:hypothetical protein
MLFWQLYDSVIFPVFGSTFAVMYPISTHVIPRIVFLASCTFARIEDACYAVLSKNPGLFKQASDGIKHAEVLKVMMESGYMPDKPIRTKKTK